MRRGRNLPVMKRLLFLISGSTRTLFVFIFPIGGNDLLSAGIDPVAIVRALNYFALFIIDVFHVTHIIWANLTSLHG